VSKNEHPQPASADGGRSRAKVLGATLAATATAGAGLVAAIVLVAGSAEYAAPPSPGAVPSTQTSPPPVGTLPGISGDKMYDALADLVPANIAFNTPTELHLDEEEAVRLLVSREQAIEELQEQLEAAGREEGYRIEVSDVIVAKLTGLDFDIEPTSDSRQPVLSTGVTMWGWSVEPTEPGTRSLHLTISALIDVGGTEETLTLKTFDRTWTVVVPWPDRVTGFAGENWQWLWTAILLPLGAIVWRRLRMRQRGAERPVAHS
jgi:hypothetical protein